MNTQMCLFACVSNGHIQEGKKNTTHIYVMVIVMGGMGYLFDTLLGIYPFMVRVRFRSHNTENET